MSYLRRFFFTLPLAVVLCAWPYAAGASISSRVLIDPAGEGFADFFGTSVAWVGDVNGDGYDDLLVGAFRYPDLASVGQAYLYFGGTAIDSVPTSSSRPRPAAQDGSGSASPPPGTSTATAIRTSSSGRNRRDTRARPSSITADRRSMRRRTSRSPASRRDPSPRSVPPSRRRKT